jgi:tRNA threonylcarbamoyl adenosine modification protein (Sua5/YciO/YrdC/YwlC family)
MIRYSVHPVSPQRRILDKTVDVLKNHEGICIYPTDTVYGMGACANNPKALDKIGRIIQKDKGRFFSFICSDFSQMSEYVRISNEHYKLMKHYLPGPYTFILPATHYVPKKISPKRRTVGVRIPACPVCIELVKILGVPLANTSLSIAEELRGDPSCFEHGVFEQTDIFLDCGILENPTGSTIIDLTDDYPEVIRLGKGEWHG